MGALFTLFSKKEENMNEEKNEETSLKIEQQIEWERKRDELLKRLREHKFIYEKGKNGLVEGVYWDDRPDENLLYDEKLFPRKGRWESFEKERKKEVMEQWRKDYPALTMEKGITENSNI